MGKKRKFRTLKDLYDATQPLQPTQFPSFPPFKTETEETSTACILCATRSSCVHFNRVASITGVGAGDFTDKTSKKKGASQSSSNDGSLFCPSLSSTCNCRQHTGNEREPFECSSNQVESSLAKTSIFGLGNQIYGTYRIATFEGAGDHLNCFEIENHPYDKNHLQESVVVIKNTGMQESRQPQLGNPGDVPNLMDDWVKVCDTCGDVGYDHALVSCNKCIDGAQHTYCMSDNPEEVPVNWICEECKSRAKVDKLIKDKAEGATRRKKGRLSESSKSKCSKLKFRSSSARKSRTNGVNSTTCLLAKRHAIPLEAQQVKKSRAIETSLESPRSSKPYNNSLLRKDLSCKKFKRVKIRSINDIVYSSPQRSCNSQEKEKVPHACGSKEHVSTLAKLGRKGMDCETSAVSPKASNSHNRYIIGREPPSEKLRRVTLKAASSVTCLKQSSYGTKKKAKFSYCLGDGSPKLGSQTKITHDKCSLLESSSSKAANLKPKIQLAKAGCLLKQKVERNPAFHEDRKGKGPSLVSKSMSFNGVISEESNAYCSEVLLPDAYELHNRAMCLLASDSGVTSENSKKETISSGDTLFSGSSFHNLDVVECTRKSDHRLQASKHNIHNDSDCLNKMKNDSPQVEHGTKATTTMMMKVHASNERSHLRDLAQLEAGTLSKGLVIPKSHYAWLGKFQIHNSEGIAGTLDGIQAHLSICTSLEVIEMVDRLPEIIILEELPRLSILPSQFMGSKVTEENIALYFFAKDVDSYNRYYGGLMNYMMKNDLALKGNLDGVELLIFSSNILPEKTQRWNQMLFIWGVFKGRNVNDSTNTPISNSLKEKNRDTLKNRAFDLNAYPEDLDDESGFDEIPKFDSIGGTTQPSAIREVNVNPLVWQGAELLMFLSGQV